MPLTVTGEDVKATVVQLFGPYAVKVIVPPAGPPAVVGLIAGVPGLFAVRPRVALSLIALPSTTGPAPACVDSDGVTGAIVKHSLVVSSSASGTPEVDDVKCADQQ